MRRNYRNFALFGAMALAGVGIATGQSKLDTQAMMAIANYNIAQQEALNGHQRQAAPAEEASVIVTLQPGVDAAVLEKYGAEVLTQAGSIAVCNVPVKNIEDLAADEAVAYVSLSRQRQAMMINALPSMNTDKVQKGTGLDAAYTGKGVITGIVDTGLDPNHIHFRNHDDASEYRVDRVFHFTSGNGQFDEYTAAWRFDTDTPNETHGTHVLGIMAGSYQGEARVATVSGNKGNVQTQNNPYYGVAYDSNIAASCMTELSDANIMVGVEQIVKYAEEVGKPAVINISLGSINGPHDPSDPVAAYLTEMGKRAIICVAAGNDADDNLSVSRRFTAENNLLATAVKFTNRAQFQATVISDDERPFQLTVSSVTTSGAQTFKFEVPQKAGVYTITNGGTTNDENFSKMFTNGSQLQIAVSTTPTNRYMVEIGGRLTYVSAGTRLGLEARGEVGQNVNIWASADLVSNGIPGWSTGNNKQTISSMACADNIVSVGSYNPTNRFATLGGNVSTYPSSSIGEIDGVSAFSSYGTMVDGSTRPHILGPGAPIVSSISTFYVNSRGPAALNGYSASAFDPETSNTNYWEYSIGTSMACPAVAGVVALWLQANPELTVDDVKKVMKATARPLTRGLDASPAQVGWGAIDALEGLKMVLDPSYTGISPVFDPAAEGNGIVFERQADNRYLVSAPGVNAIAVQVYDMQGRLVKEVHATGAQASVDAQALGAGQYIMRAQAAAGFKSQKFVVR